MDLHTYSFDPVILNAGLMKPRRGFTLVAGEEKLVMGKPFIPLFIPLAYPSLSLPTTRANLRPEECAVHPFALFFIPSKKRESIDMGVIIK